VSLAISMFILQTTWIYVLLGAVGVCVTVHLMMIKTKLQTCLVKEG